jgi:LPXTG-site transpeptidase (sortase) family protein
VYNAQVQQTLSDRRIIEHNMPMLYLCKKALRIHVHKKTVSHKSRRAKTSRKTFVLSRATILYVIAGLIVIVGGLLAVQAYMVNKQVATQLDGASGSGGQNSALSVDLPTDDKPTDKNFIENYAVASGLPRIIEIPKIDVKARVLHLGTDDEGKVDVPKTSYDTAWYNESVSPGTVGAALIDGHVRSVGGDAVFTRLAELVPGDEITIEMGNGKHNTFAVTSVETVPLNGLDMKQLLISSDASKPGLNLITCGGTYDYTARTFQDRTIVKSVLIK